MIETEFFLQQIVNKNQQTKGGEEDVAMATEKPPHSLRGDLECSSSDGNSLNRDQHHMYCRQRLTMLRTNAAMAIRRVTHARNSVCLKCFRSLRAWEMAAIPL